MTLNRRSLVLSAAGLAGLSRLLTLDRPTKGAALPAKRQNAPLLILFLGGTGFIGPHMVRQALDHGHTVTLFSRGRSGTNLFPGV